MTLTRSASSSSPRFVRFRGGTYPPLVRSRFRGYSRLFPALRGGEGRDRRILRGVFRGVSRARRRRASPREGRPS